MKNKIGSSASESVLKTSLWILVAVYTLLLPFFIFVYRAILNSFGKEVVGKIPLIMVVLMGISYGVAVLRRRKNWKYLLFLIPCGIITFLIMKYETNPNKHIHIPEYVLMAWLLFAVLSRDHKGNGIFMLIFIYASLLGVVDELEQGILPSRFYGWSDMLVNSASSIIGILTIQGLIKVEAGKWEWVKQLKEFYELVWLEMLGLVGTVIMCVHLFQVQAEEKFWGIYPVWLWIWSLLFLLLTPLMVFFHFRKRQRSHQTTAAKTGIRTKTQMTTAGLWIYPMLAILFYIHALLIIMSITGISFI